MQLKDKKILITGAAGFVGANLTERFIQEKAKVHALIRSTTDLWRLQSMANKINMHIVDLTDFTTLSAIVNKIQPNIIVHLARQNPYLTTSKNRDFVMTNILGTYNLLEATQKLDYQAFIYSGSLKEYGTKNKPMREDDFLLPDCIHGVTKASASLICQQFARANKKPIVMLRIFDVYGYKEPITKLIPICIRKTFNKEEILLTSPGYKRDFIFIEDLVDAFLLTMRNKKAYGEIINIGSGTQTSNEEIVDMIQNLMEIKTKINMGIYKAHPTDKYFCVADINKAKNLLGWKPKHTLEQGLQKMIECYKQQLNKH